MTSRSWQRWLLAFWALCFAFFVFYSSRVMLTDGFMSLYGGRWVAQHGIPHADPFTVYGQGRQWLNQQWLAHWSYYQLWQVGGYRLVAGTSAALIGLSFGMLAAVLALRGTPPMRIVIFLAFGVVVCMTNAIVRAQSYAYPLFMLGTMLLLWTRPLGQRLPGPITGHARWAPWVLLPLVAFWGNVHGSAIAFATFAVAVLGVSAIERTVLVARRRAGATWAAAGRDFAVALLMPLMLLVTPYGLDMVGYYRSVLRNPVLSQFIVEWQAANFADLQSFAFFTLVAMALFVVGFAAGRGSMPRADWLVGTVVLALAGAAAIRSQIWFAFPAIILICDLLNDLTGKNSKPAPVPTLPAVVAIHRAIMAMLRPASALIVGLAAVAAGIALLFATSNSEYETFVDRELIAHTFDQAGATGNVLTDEVTSTGLLWKHPELAGRVAFDGRFEVFAQRDIREWIRFLTTTDKRGLRVVNGMDVIALSSGATYRDRRETLDEIPGFEVVYRAKKHGVVVRRAGGVSASR